MTRKNLNPMAADLGIDLARIRRSRSKKSEQGFWIAVDTVVSGLIRANPAVSRDRFIGAVKTEAKRVEETLSTIR